MLLAHVGGARSARAADSRGRRASHASASTSGRDALAPAPRRPRAALQVRNALFEPPPFQPSKLEITMLPGSRVGAGGAGGPLPPPASPRRYTLTHNDLTGALRLSIGAEYNARQMGGFYTRLLRDEVTAEWRAGAAAGAAPELHVYCHVSGQERWLAPPRVRNFIFRREMALVLDTFIFGDRALLAAHPELREARVTCHFQSHVRALQRSEPWGVLGERGTWRAMPSRLSERLKLLLFGFPEAVPALGDEAAPAAPLAPGLPGPAPGLEPAPAPAPAPAPPLAAAAPAAAGQRLAAAVAAPSASANCAAARQQAPMQLACEDDGDEAQIGRWRPRRAVGSDGAAPGASAGDGPRLLPIGVAAARRTGGP